MSSDSPTAAPRLHRHLFPNGNKHRHAHGFIEGHAEAVNEAHPQPYYFLCHDCEPERARLLLQKTVDAVEAEWTDEQR